MSLTYLEIKYKGISGNLRRTDGLFNRGAGTLGTVPGNSCLTVCMDPFQADQ